MARFPGPQECNLLVSLKVLTFQKPIYVVLFVPKVVNDESVRLSSFAVSLIMNIQECR